VSITQDNSGGASSTATSTGNTATSTPAP
jgi:hypothetical protein